jgi:hypothetical protein
MMNVDWRSLTWWEYQARLVEWNNAHDPAPPAPDYDRLSRVLEAHSGRC